MKGEIKFNKEYKTGKMASFTEWHAGNYFHSISQAVIKFLDDKNMIWYQEYLDGTGSPSSIINSARHQVFKGQYSLDKYFMISARLEFESIMIADFMY